MGIFHPLVESEIIGQEGGTEGIDNDFLKRGSENLGAWIIGRNMFGPVRGPHGQI